MRSFLIEFLRAAREAPRLYFAPLTGAIEGIRDALRETR